MPVILPKGKEKDWLCSSNNLTEILRRLEIFTADRMNACPVSRDISLPGPHPIRILNPVGDRLYAETEKKFNPRKHWGHKQKGAGDGTWRGKLG